MAIYDLYGSSSDDLQMAKESLEETLSIRFDARDSEFHGGEYFQWRTTCGDHFLLKRNVDPIDGGPAELSFPRFKTLLCLNDTRCWKELHEKIRNDPADYALLRHENLE